MSTPLYKRFKSVTDVELRAQQLALDGLQNYTFGSKLEEVYEKNGDLLQEVWMATEMSASQMQYTIRITELRDINVAQYVLHEVKVLHRLGINKRIMSAFAVFRNKAYVAYVQPAYTAIRNRIVARYRYKRGEDDGVSFTDQESTSGWSSASSDISEIFSEIKSELKKSPGVLSRNSVAFVLRKVIKGLKYLHSAGFVHTQLNTSDIYMNENCYVKLSGFGYCRRLGSKTWKFTGNANFFAPEACLPDNGKRSLEPSFDMFGLGLLTMEMISGRRPNYNNDKARQFLKDLMDGKEDLQTLKDYDESCFRKGRCVYDKDVEHFLSNLLALNPNERFTLEQAYKHPFVSRKVDKNKAVEMWTTNEVAMSSDESSPMLRGEMLGSQGLENDMDTEHLARMIQAVRLAEQEFFPVFNKVSDSKLFANYIGVESSVATPFIENDWSRDVLDISDDQLGRFDSYCKNYQLNSSERPAENAPDYYNRNDQIFFVKRSWSTDERQLFVALQFARWYTQGFIEFSDMIRLSCDVEDLIKEYVVEDKDAPTKKLFWSTQMRRLIKNPNLYKDPITRSLCRVYSSISMNADDMKKLKKKYDDLASNDPIQLSSDKTTLSLSVMFRELDLKRFRRMEDQLLGKARVENWNFDPNHRERNDRLRPLLKERRMNPNKEQESHNASFEEDQAVKSNQARLAKIWGVYDRDFVYKTCKVNAVDYKLSHADATSLYGNPFDQGKPLDKIKSLDEIESLEKDMLRTKIYQERDHIDPFQKNDYIEARKQAFEQKDKWDSEVRSKEGLTPSKRVAIDVSRQAKRFDANYDDPESVYPSPAPKLGKHLRKGTSKNAKD